MAVRCGVGGPVAEFIHARFLWLLVAAYVGAAIVPDMGRWLTHVNASFPVCGLEVRVSAPKVMLATLLFAAGLPQ